MHDAQLIIEVEYGIDQLFEYYRGLILFQKWVFLGVLE